MQKPRALPRVDGQPWCSATKKWFAAWRDSPVTDEWDERMWQYLFDTALVHQAVWYDGMLQSLGELRAREQCMGLVFDAKATARKSGSGASVLQMVMGDRASKERAANG